MIEDNSAVQDGGVNITDLLTLLNNDNHTGKDWSEGDFNYDGTVNVTDLLALPNNY
jgi:Dockerin type I domain